MHFLRLWGFDENEGLNEYEDDDDDEGLNEDDDENYRSPLTFSL